MSTESNRRSEPDVILRVLSWDAVDPNPESWGGERAEARDELKRLRELERGKVRKPDPEFDPHANYPERFREGPI